MVASNNAMAKKGLEIYRAFRLNGIDDPTGVMDGILKAIAQRATYIKRKHETFDPNNILGILYLKTLMQKYRAIKQSLYNLLLQMIFHLNYCQNTLISGSSVLITMVCHRVEMVHPVFPCSLKWLQRRLGER